MLGDNEDVDDLFKDINSFTLKSLSLDDYDDKHANDSNNNNNNSNYDDKHANDSNINNDNNSNNITTTVEVVDGYEEYDVTAYDTMNYNDDDNKNDNNDDDDYNDEYDNGNDEPDWVELASNLEDALLNRSSYQPLYVLTHNGGYSTEALFSAIATANGNIDDAIKIVIAAEEQIYNCRPCRHLKNGSCLRTDCKFDHDLSTTPCKYWILDCKCSLQQNGEYCPFLHDFSPAVLESLQNNNNNNNKSLILDTEEEFPTLKAKPKTTTTTTNDKITAASLSKTLFQTVGSDNRQPTVFGSSQAMSPPSSSRKVIASSKSNEQLARKGKEISLSEWVSSGQSVANEYENSRREARSLALARNALLQEATNAYVAGKKDIAKNLSMQGQKMNTQMKELHLSAAKNIFCTRNQEALLKKGKVDMHGLHVSEALSVLEEILPLYKSLSIPSVTIVTGTGHHSVDKHRAGVLLPNIENYIKGLKLKYKTINDPNNGMTGGLVIDMSS